MKENRFTKALINFLVYLLIGMSCYLLYSPHNDHPNNKTGSAITFVYQQF